MNKLLLFILSYPFIAFCQKKSISEDSLINKWTHATINIQCINRFTRIEDSLYKMVRENKLSRERHFLIMDSITLRTPRNEGTALFFEKDDHYYVLTARHVLFDETTWDTNSICERIILVESPSTLNHPIGTYITP
jgi:hypothetical protein